MNDRRENARVAWSIDCVPQTEQVACCYGEAQTNKPTKLDGRVVPLSPHYIMLIRPQQAIQLAEIL